MEEGGICCCYGMDDGVSVVAIGWRRGHLLLLWDGGGDICCCYGMDDGISVVVIGWRRGISFLLIGWMTGISVVAIGWRRGYPERHIHSIQVYLFVFLISCTFGLKF